jgi:glycosyltransferase involved in cell wall biosynthesis
LANITFLGNFEVPYSSENHHAKSLEFLGHSVKKLQEKKVRSEAILDRALKSDLFIWVHTHGWQTTGKMTMDDVLRRLKKAGIPTITYHLDLWFGLERQKDLEQDNFYKTIGHFFTVDKLMADWFNENTQVKGHFIPAGVYDKECYIHNAYNPYEFKYDVIFVGSKRYHHEHQYRSDLIDFLRETYGKRFLHVGGDGDTGTIRGDALNQIYAQSKVAVGDSLNINFNYPYYTSDRLFESTGRGGFTIYPRITGLEEYFEDGNEIVFYEHGNLEDLKTKIDKYLDTDLDRERIRLNGHERTKQEHTYVHRWATIMNELGIK